ncbi:MAG TPA: class I adenylate-forming enzyme family protein [Myxococcota bacterium]|nr:class I adenylate-forming enzyme family protein [Myxococcota bacterium]
MDLEPLARRIDALARGRPDALAFAADGVRTTWASYARRSDRLAQALLGLDLARGERVAVWLPDGPGVHAAYVGCEKAGQVVVGIGPRAGLRELRHLLDVSGARALVSRATHRGVDLAAFVSEARAAGAPLAHHVVVEGEAEEDAPLAVDGAASDPSGRPPAERSLAADELFLLNSTSGTTGLPKCVTHDQARWFAFHRFAVEAGALSPGDVFLSALPAPFGFGLWTAHFTPALLGAPTVLTPRFDAAEALRAIERHRVTVLAAVSTQFVLMLESLALAQCDLSSLRVLFTGGEAVPAERAARFEAATGARVLQFYGSNETGALSRTTLADPPEIRHRSAGRVLPEMQVRLFDDEGRDVTASGRGQPGCRGPATSRGYWNDAAANARLYTADGWMLTGDVAELDRDGVLRVVGRKADFIIRGGKNVSAAEVEAEVGTHPAVALAAAVAMPDPIFGERVCVYVEPRPGRTLTLAELGAHLAERGLGLESHPERLVVLPELPRASGGKIAKGALRDDIRRRLAEEAASADAPAAREARGATR